MSERQARYGKNIHSEGFMRNFRKFHAFFGGTQKELSDRMGLSETMCSLVLSGKRELSHKRQLEICEKLGVRISDFTSISDISE